MYEMQRLQHASKWAVLSFAVTTLTSKSETKKMPERVVQQLQLTLS